MAKKKAVEPPEIDVQAKVKELLEKRKESSPQVQKEIDQQLLELTSN